MTDEQIIKAYEGLTPRQQLNLYRNLYYKDGNATERGVVANAINALLTVYNRQKAEIERLRQKLDYECERCACELLDQRDRAKPEAIREFAERLKRKSRRISEYDEGGWYMDIRAVKVEDIDNLVKEMTEDKS